VVVTDNIKREILTQYSISENFDVIIHVPVEKIKKIDIDTTKLKGISEALEKAHDMALNKNYQDALRINGLTYGTAMGLDNKITTKALAAGAITAGITGTGPATVILVEPKNKDKIISAIGTKDQIICTAINRKKAGMGKIED
jgi:shikimate kinase